MAVRIGRYEIKKEIGRGAAGIVYRAYDPKLGRIVAVKILRTDILDSEERDDFARRFRREAQTAGKLSHPNIVTIHDLGEVNNILFIIMELITGITLKELIDESESLNVKHSLDILSQISSGLDYAHKNKIIHRDIKPSNIIITSKNVAKITDFGIAKISGTESTQAGRVLGTPYYMSPEQFTGREVAHKSDLFSFGIMAYMLFYGRKPFEGDTLHRVAYQIVNESPSFPQDNRLSSNRQLVKVLQRAMSKDPEGRYNSACEFVSQLKRALFEDIGDYSEELIEIAKMESLDTSDENTTIGGEPCFIEGIADETGFRPGDVIAHYYRIISEIGPSNVATVYIAENINLGRQFAVKKIHPSLMFDDRFIDIFKREIRAQAGLSHPNIAQIVHFDPPTLSVIQEFVEGETIFQILNRKGVLSRAEALSIIRGVLEGLDYAHRHGMIHREIKPTNIMVDRNGTIKITDFGIALIIIEDRKDSSGIGLGVPEYMSPEQIRGDRAVDLRTDIYSLGLLSYEMLTGKVPFARDKYKNFSDFAILELQLYQAPEPPVNLRPDIGDKLSDIILKALEKKPENRFKDCREFLSAIDSL